MKDEPQPTSFLTDEDSTEPARPTVARRLLASRRGRFALLLVAVLAMATLGFGTRAIWVARTRTPVAPDDRAQMLAAERVIDSLRWTALALDRPNSTPKRISGAALLALSYHERFRIGAGSPFRIADYAL